jgi:hypothetical protein
MFESIDQFMSYCDSHSQTERALFSKEQCIAILEIAGVDEKDVEPTRNLAIGSWRSIPREQMVDLLAMAKENLARNAVSVTFGETLLVNIPPQMLEAPVEWVKIEGSAQLDVPTKKVDEVKSRAPVPQVIKSNPIVTVTITI